MKNRLKLLEAVQRAHKASQDLAAAGKDFHEAYIALQRDVYQSSSRPSATAELEHIVGPQRLHVAIASQFCALGLEQVLMQPSMTGSVPDRVFENLARDIERLP